MKFFIVILALVVLVSAEWKPKSREEMKQFRVQCVKDLNLPQDLIDKVNRLEYPSDNDLIKEFILCGARKSELWNESEGWLLNRIMRLLKNDKTPSNEEEEMRQIIEGCLDDNSQGSSLQDWTFRNFKCLVESKLADSMRGLMKKLN